MAIVVVNKSTLVSDADAALMTQACSYQLAHHVAPLWGAVPTPVTFLPGKAAVPAAGSWAIAILDDADQAGALGYHTESKGDVVWGKVFARPVLTNGGSVLTGQLSVAAVLSHEVLETFADPHVQLWAQANSRTLVAVEICDPVEEQAYDVAAIGADGAAHAVSVSNFVTPHWFDAQASSGEQFDYLKTIHRPFRMSPGGYMIQMRSGAVTQVFGENYAEWRKAAKAHPLARAAQLIAKAGH